MNRRKYIKALAAVPLTPSIPEFDENESGEGESEDEWNVRGVWRREDDTGYLAIRDDDYEEELDSYNEWVQATIEASNSKHTVNLFDFDLVSVYDGTYARSHFAHDCGLEVTIKRDPSDDEMYTAVVRHVGESWEDRREYSSNAQIAIAQKCKQELEEYR